MTLDEAADKLYGSGLDEFVSERTRLVKELRAAGNTDDATTLATSRKPTVAAWVLNQLARRERRDVDLLLDAGHRLREAQASALSGADKRAFEHAAKTQNEALRRLRGEAQRLLKEERSGASVSVLNQVEEALRASAISQTGREALARGRFVEPMKAEGFDVVSQLAPAAPKQSPTRVSPAAQKEELRKANEALKAAGSRLREAERNAVQAKREAERLSRESEKARSDADAAQAQVDLATADVERAEATLKKAKRT